MSTYKNFVQTEKKLCEHKVSNTWLDGCQSWIENSQHPASFTRMSHKLKSFGRLSTFEKLTRLLKFDRPDKRSCIWPILIIDTCGNFKEIRKTKLSNWEVHILSKCKVTSTKNSTYLISYDVLTVSFMNWCMCIFLQEMVPKTNFEVAFHPLLFALDLPLRLLYTVSSPPTRCNAASTLLGKLRL